MGGRDGRFFCRCGQFTGAEIEAVFIDAICEAFAEGKEPGPKHILEAMTRTVPLAQLMDGQKSAPPLARRDWQGRSRPVPNACRSTADGSPTPTEE